MARRLAFINEKGGSCKTTLAVSVASFLAGKAGKRVLLVDGDPQGQAGKCLGLDVNEPGVTLADLMSHPRVAGPAAAIRPCAVPNLGVVVANKSLAQASMSLFNRGDKETVLRGLLDRLETDHDFVIFDGPPSLSLLSNAIMLAVHELIVPVPLTFLAMDGCAEILDTVDSLRSRTGHDVEVTMMVPTLYRPTRLADEILTRLRTHFGPLVAKTVIGYCVKIDEAQSHGQTIWDYAPTSSGALALADLCREIARPPARRAAGKKPRVDA
jgi:chromosome partitioning protein